MATPPFDIDNSAPADDDNISAFPANERTNRGIIEDWLTYISDPSTGLLKASAFPDDVSFATITLTGSSITYSASGLTQISAGSADGSDDQSLFINGGGSGSTSRGGILAVYGNEDDTRPGYVRLIAGAVTGGKISLEGDLDQTTGTADFGATTLASASVTGNLTVGGNTTFDSFLISSDTAAILATTGAGEVYLRPNGSGSTTGQASLNSSGTLTATKFSGDGSLLTGLPDSGGVVDTVTAGSGLTGGGSASTVTLNVGAGTGITVAADTVSVDSTVWTDDAPPAASVLTSVLADASAGAIGTYAYLQITTGTGGTSGYTLGQTFSGSELRYAVIDTEGDVRTLTTRPSGTWQLMAGADSWSTPNHNIHGLFMRIS